MKIRYMSDLHLEFPWSSPDWLPSIGEDVVVLAGDIGVGVRGIRWATQTFRGRPVLYVMGNHEFYRHHWNRLVDEARAAARGTNVHLLERDRVEIDGVLFLGATLWTDFQLYGPALRVKSMIAGRDALADFQYIEGPDGHVLTPQASIDRHLLSVEWLRREIEAATQPTVVITHHSPTLANQHPRYAGSDLGPCFHSNREDLFLPPVRLWISGHTHHSCETQVNGILLLSNQRGYPREGVSFNWDAMADVSGGLQ